MPTDFQSFMVIILFCGRLSTTKEILIQNNWIALYSSEKFNHFKKFDGKIVMAKSCYVLCNVLP